MTNAFSCAFRSETDHLTGQTFLKFQDSSGSCFSFSNMTVTLAFLNVKFSTASLNQAISSELLNIPLLSTRFSYFARVGRRCVNMFSPPSSNVSIPSSAFNPVTSWKATSAFSTAPSSLPGGGKLNSTRKRKPSGILYSGIVFKFFLSVWQYVLLSYFQIQVPWILPPLHFHLLLNPGFLSSMARRCS